MRELPLIDPDELLGYEWINNYSESPEKECTALIPKE
jgi:hypothetical protein